LQLFDPALPFLKGNTHIHTSLSDGKYTPEAAIDLYRQNGYDFITLTDHNRQSPERVEEGLLVLSGTELDYTLPHQVVHLTAFALDGAVDLSAARVCAQAGIDAIRAAGGRAILAHPAWSLNTLDTLTALSGVSALEIYNAVSATPYNADRALSASFSDVASANGCVVPVVCADDTHFYERDACRTCIYVNARENTRAALLEAFDAGRFYASCGPKIEQVTVENGLLTVRCSPARQIVFYSNRPWVSGRCVQGEALCEATYPIGAADTFVRIEVEDDQGNRAFVSPMRVNE
jgi:hypothetical protein